MADRRTTISIVAAAAAMFVLVYMLTQPAIIAQPPATMKLPTGGGPTRRALAQARTDALHAANEAPAVPDAEPEADSSNATAAPAE